MAHTTANKRGKVARHFSSNGSDSMDGDGLVEKDETELELERQIFGDDGGFHKHLSSYGEGSPLSSSALAKAGGQNEQDAEEEQGLEGVDDAAVRATAFVLNH